MTGTGIAQEKLNEVLNSSGAPGASARVAAVRGPHGCVHGWRLAIEAPNTPPPMHEHDGGGCQHRWRERPGR